MPIWVGERLVFRLMLTNEVPGTPLPLPVDEKSRLLAAGLAGDLTALAWAADQLGLVASGAAVRLGPALYLRARAHGIAGSAVAEWRQAFAAQAANRMDLQRAMGSVAGTLANAGIAWAPIKGMDTGTRVYGVPEERPTGDLDVLVPADRFAEARTALCAGGWRDLHTSLQAEAYLADEGYNWQAVNAQGTLLELHFRLWGIMPEVSAGEVISRSSGAPELGPTARRIALSDALVLACVHATSQRSPRPLLYFWELDLLAAAAPGVADDAAATAEGWGLQLPVGLAAAVSSALFPGGASAPLAARLLGALRASERLLARRCRRKGFDAVSLGDVYLARLLARRPSRAGWSAVPRRLWPHPGVVEMRTPETWPRWVRRAVCVLNNLPSRSLAGIVRRWADSRY